MNRNSNIYSILYASIMVILVAGVLAGVSLLLKDRQNANVEAEKMQSILKAANVETTRDEARKLYDEYFSETFVVNNQGEPITGIDAFKVNMSNEIKVQPNERKLPVYVFHGKEEGKKYVVPIYGAGMWGPIWGFLAIDENKSTIYGATFDHASETPGLGAEIATEWFQEQFKGKEIFDENGNFQSITLVKGGADASNKHGVDAVSGGTVTSRGLTETLRKCLGDYEQFLKSEKTE
ncbi:Na+-transporting NADH:ubiquinone oxidoreductase subunit C [Balneicella halophila]|uniref:Na(+)-translocating NADH-quinone reductase subunit C n=1 Tax=Balneicella halophila TaxID=1537566 RepID=A0A7L4US75_BALHA|nr:NADH:ubiquinone reductase (Na(+)-transporting) subunit C [Balneicella halophila]PVX52623.1 Na+-transporting NADH:ubiquinone oxidoreductase subunit C [Balneicella halophila]